MNVGDPIGKFQVMGTLGQGAHSTIMHVRRASDGKQYALKVVTIDEPDDLKFLEQARHEFRVGSMLDHPSCLKVYALEEQKNWLFKVKKAHLLVEFVNGKTLDNAIWTYETPFPAMAEISGHLAFYPDKVKIEEVA